jgi:hypothetical protein
VKQLFGVVLKKYNGLKLDLHIIEHSFIHNNVYLDKKKDEENYVGSEGCAGKTTRLRILGNFFSGCKCNLWGA